MIQKKTRPNNLPTPIYLPPPSCTSSSSVQSSKSISSTLPTNTNISTPIHHKNKSITTSIKNNRSIQSQPYNPKSNKNQLYNPLYHQQGIWSRSSIMQHCPTYYNNFSSSSSSSSLCSSKSTASYKSFTTESTNTYKNSTSPSPIPCTTKIPPMFCLPIHSPTTPDNINNINKPSQQSISPIHNSPSPSLINISIQKENISTNIITSTNSSHSSQNTSSPQTINKYNSHSLLDKPIQMQSIDNSYITGNLLYGDPITEQNSPTSRIIYNNVNG